MLESRDMIKTLDNTPRLSKFSDTANLDQIRKNIEEPNRLIVNIIY